MHCVVDEAAADTSCTADVECDTGDFECNICLDLAYDPVVTLCGHLYCWPCLFRWLDLHSYRSECPLCKAIIEENKLIPIYGRGKTVSYPSSQSSGFQIPKRPAGQRPPTAPSRGVMSYVSPNDLDPLISFMPMAAARIGHLTLSTIFGTLPAIFNLQVHGFHDATVYGSTSGVPYSFSGSFHGGYGHGFHNYHSAPVEWKPFILKIVLIFLVCVVLLHLILAIGFSMRG